MPQGRYQRPCVRAIQKCFFFFGGDAAFSPADIIWAWRTGPRGGRPHCSNPQSCCPAKDINEPFPPALGAKSLTRAEDGHPRNGAYDNRHLQRQALPKVPAFGTRSSFAAPLKDYPPAESTRARPRQASAAPRPRPRTAAPELRTSRRLFFPAPLLLESTPARRISARWIASPTFHGGTGEEADLRRWLKAPAPHLRPDPLYGETTYCPRMASITGRPARLKGRESALHCGPGPPERLIPPAWAWTMQKYPSI